MLDCTIRFPLSGSPAQALPPAFMETEGQGPNGAASAARRAARSVSQKDELKSGASREGASGRQVLNTSGYALTIRRILGVRAFWAQISARRIGKIRTSEMDLTRLFGEPERPGKNEPHKSARWTLRIEGPGDEATLIAVIYDFQQMGAARHNAERRVFSVAGSADAVLPVLKSILTGCVSSSSRSTPGFDLDPEGWAALESLAEGEGVQGAVSLLLGDRPALFNALRDAQKQGAAPLQGIELTKRLTLRQLRPLCKRLLAMR